MAAAQKQPRRVLGRAAPGFFRYCTAWLRCCCCCCPNGSFTHSPGFPATAGNSSSLGCLAATHTIAHLSLAGRRTRTLAAARICFFYVRGCAMLETGRVPCARCALVHLQHRRRRRPLSYSDRTHPHAKYRHTKRCATLGDASLRRTIGTRTQQRTLTRAHADSIGVCPIQEQTHRHGKRPEGEEAATHGRARAETHKQIFSTGTAAAGQT